MKSFLRNRGWCVLLVLAAVGYSAQVSSATGICASCPPAANWVDNCHTGDDILQTTWAVVGIDTNMDGAIDQTLTLSGGPMTVHRAAAVGTNPATIATEILSMTLTGGGATLRVGTQTPGINVNVPHTMGQVTEQPDNTQGVCDFGVYFEIDLGGGQKLYNHDALHVSAVTTCAPPAAHFLNTQPVALFTLPVGGDQQGQIIAVDHSTEGPPATEICSSCPPSGNWIDNCSSGTDSLSTTWAQVGIDMDGDGDVDQTVVLSGPATIHRAAPVGTSPATIATEILSMTLTGGGVMLRAGRASGAAPPLTSSTGTLVEQPDNTKGVCDFGVYFEIDLGGGQKLYNHDALHVSAVTTCAPPGVHFVGNGPVALYSASGLLQPQRIITVDHSTGESFPEFGACCLPNNACVLGVSEATCHTTYAGNFEGNGTTFCTHNPNGTCVLGACCLPSNGCTLDVTVDQCAKMGHFMGYGTTACLHNTAGDCIPTVSEWGLLVMAVLVLTAATVVIMRRRAMVRGGS